MYVATCHCGNVRIETEIRTETVTECNCSICVRYGARYAYYQKHQVRLSVGKAGISSYRWGDKIIEFYHCNRCGCVTHYECPRNDGTERFAVNVRMFPTDVYENVRVRHFDGADTWSYID